MARCKLCKKTTTDGTEYCNECIDKKDLIDSESYLDSLLNSVQGEATTASDIYTKRKAEEPTFSIDIEDLNDFEQFDISKDLDDYLNDYLNDTTDINDKDLHDTTNDIEPEDDLDIHNNIDNEFLDMEKQETDKENEDDSIDPAFDDLLKQVEFYSDNINSEISDMDDNQAGIEEAEIEEAEIEEESLDVSDDKEGEVKEADDTIKDSELTPEDELLNLLNQFNLEDPVDGDVQTITELLGEIGQNMQEDVYSDDVDEVSFELIESNDLSEEPDNGIQYITQEDNKEGNDLKNNKRIKSTKKETSREDKGIFSRLFGNIKDDQDKDTNKQSFNVEEAATREKEKRKKKKPSKKALSTDQDEMEEVSNKGKRDTKDKKKDKKKVKKAKKEKKKVEPIEIIEDIDEGRINRVGATLIFAFFGIIAFLLLITTDLFTYSQSIKNASDYFDRQKYTQAYNEIYGLELKDEDIELYDKIMTVMYVNKQLDSYKNYYQMRKFPEALDSLLKGLQRYDKYIEIATIRGIKEDLDYIKQQIIDELYSVFSLTEEKAMDILNNEDQEKYSKAVYDVILSSIVFY